MQLPVKLFLIRFRSQNWVLHAVALAVVPKSVRTVVEMERRDITTKVFSHTLRDRDLSVWSVLDRDMVEWLAESPGHISVTLKVYFPTNNGVSDFKSAGWDASGLWDFGPDVIFLRPRHLVCLSLRLVTLTLTKTIQAGRNDFDVHICVVVAGLHEPPLHDVINFLRPYADELNRFFNYGSYLIPDFRHLRVHGVVMPLLCDLPLSSPTARHFRSFNCSFCPQNVQNRNDECRFLCPVHWYMACRYPICHIPFFMLMFVHSCNEVMHELLRSHLICMMRTSTNSAISRANMIFSVISYILCQPNFII